MNDLPPAGSRRLTLAIGFWALFTILFFGIFAWRAITWLRSGDELPILAVIGGVLGLVGIWRWIATARAAQTE